MSDQPTLSGAAAFRQRSRKQEEGEVLELSSGMVVKVRRPNETKLIQSGQIPGHLAVSSINIQQGKSSPADLKNYATMIRLYAKLTVVDPVVVDGDPADGSNEISVDDLDSTELNEIYLYVTVGMDGLRQFRQERQRAAPGSDSQPVSGDQAERPLRSQEPR